MIKKIVNDKYYVVLGGCGQWAGPVLLLTQPLSSSVLHTNCPLTLETLDQLILYIDMNS